MFNNLSVKRKLYAGFGAILSVILILLALAYANLLNLSAANALDRHTLEVINELDKITSLVLSLQSEERGFIITGDEKVLASDSDEEGELARHLSRVQKLTEDNPIAQDRLGKVNSLVNTWLKSVFHPLIEARRAALRGSKEDGARQDQLVHEGANIVPGIRKLLDEGVADEGRLLVIRSRDSQNTQRNMQTMLLGGGALCIALSMVLAWMMARSLLPPLSNLSEVVGRMGSGDRQARATVMGRDELGSVALEFNRMADAVQAANARELEGARQLREQVDALLDAVQRASQGDLTGKAAVDGEGSIVRMAGGINTMVSNLRQLIENVQKAGIQVTTSATEIAASSKQQEATGVEQAQTAVEVLATTKEIASNTQQLLKTMEEATSVADYTTNATADAQTNLKRMDDTMQRMVSATDSISAKLAALSEKASNINTVLVTITKVADQTNILSLNAAIEAEKAGEAGRGFSVVATEIRRLADQTSVSTWDIEQMLKEMQSAVSASVMGMDKFSEEIRRSVGEVRQVAEQLSGVMDQVQKLAPQFDLVLQGMQSQAVGAQQITETMNQLNDATQQTVESLKATSEAVHQLQYAASDLQSSVSTFALGT